jgi:5-methylcytosine-specific restriction endonuclease McrA
MLNDPTLVLNRSWIAVTTTTVRQAMTLVCRGAARVIRPDTCETYDIRSWSDLRVAEDEPCIRTVHLRIRVPEVIVLTDHDALPRRSVPFSRRNLYRRDGYRCQYCGKSKATSELSIDHVTPRSRGGRTTWENCVLSCIPCNVKKGNRTLREAAMSLREPPQRPRWTPYIAISVGQRRASWGQFVSEQYWETELENDDVDGAE